MPNGDSLFNESQTLAFGIECLGKKDYAGALTALSKVLDLNPKNKVALLKLGHVYLQQKEYLEAIQRFEHALKIDPEFVDPHEGLGFCYFEQGRLDEAIEKFRYVSSFDRDNKHARFGLGLCCVALLKSGHVYLQQKKYSEAIQQFERALEIDPEFTDPHEGLGLCYFEQGRFGEAMEKFTHVLNFAPDNEHGRFGLGLCYQQNEEFDKAIEEFERVLKINPLHCQLHSNIGTCYFQKNDFNRAIEHFHQALKIDPDDCYARKILAQIYLEQNNPQLCIEELQKIQKAGRLDESYSYLLSRLHTQQKNYGPAVEELLKSANSGHIGKTARTFSEKPDFAHKQGNCTIKIVRIPNFYGSEIHSSEMNSIMLPPLAMGSIVSYLRSQGVTIAQDDLHIKVHHDNYFSKDFQEKIEEEIFFEDLRVIEYTKGKEDLGIDNAMERVLRKSEFRGYKIILFSLDSCSMNFSHAMFSLCLARYLKKKYNPIIILGGLEYFPELMRKLGCEWPHIDYVVCKEGEEVLSELLFSLCGFFSGDKAATRPTQRVLCAQRVPAPVKPDFDGLPLDRYQYRGLKTDYCRNKNLNSVIKEFNLSKTLLLPVRFIKGCTNRCIFCASSSGGLIHITDPKTAALWLEELQEKYNPAGYLFLDDTLNISKKYLEQLCDEIIKRRLKILWSDCVRVDRLDKSSINKMREAGCMRMVFGMETASKKMLKYINKDIDLKQLEEMLHSAHQAGIWTGVEIISGLPHETKKDIQETISFIKRNKKHIDSLYFNAFNIKDASLMSKYPERYGVTNIREISSYEDGFSTFVKYSFDEVGGLKWPEKRKQIISSVDKIVENFGQAPFPEHEYEHFLFFLYSKYNDKKKIKKLFYSVGFEKMFRTELLREEKRYARRVESYKTKALIYGGK